MPLLPALYAFLAPFGVWMFRFFIVSLIGRVVVSLGLGFATYIGFETFIDFVAAEIASSFASLPSEVSAFVGLTKIDVAASMILSAYSWRVSFQLLSRWTLVRS